MPAGHRPLGRAVIGGLLASTFVTLCALPTVYALFQEHASCHTQASSSVSTSPPAPPVVEVAPVRAALVRITRQLPGELSPYQAVALYPKEAGYIQWIGVDRGSHVRRNQLLVRLTSPERAAQRLEAQPRVSAAPSRQGAAAAQLAADTAAYGSMRMAARTPGVVAGNDLHVLAQKVQADQSLLDAARNAAAAAGQSERDADPGAFAGPQGTSVLTTGVTATGGSTGEAPVLRLAQLGRLRLTVPVPEELTGAIVPGASIAFTVPAFPGRVFTGRVARIAHALDLATRTMPVELDVMNTDGSIAPGMYAHVQWKVERRSPSLLVPAGAVIQNTTGVSLLLVQNGVLGKITVRTGLTQGDLVEVFGPVHPGDQIVVSNPAGLSVGEHVRVASSPGPS